MPEEPMTAISPAERYQTIVASFANHADVTVGAPGKGFGAAALQTHSKIFAMLASGERFVVKLPRQRVDALIDEGIGERFDPGHGRLMKEWLTVAPSAADRWLALAQEALAFVASKKS